VKSEPSWNPHYFLSSPAFAPLRSASEFFYSFENWPQLHDYACLFQYHHLSLIPVPQDDAAKGFEQRYESRIYLQQEIQIKLNGWHDFFNALCWVVFPRSKQALNQLHYHASLQRPAGTNRSTRENTLALFDESGMIIISDRAELLAMIRRHQWQELFVHNRDAFRRHCRCLVYGHAMYEKLLRPYVGMTAKALLIESPELLLDDVTAIDPHVADTLLAGNISEPSQLAPMPVLGIPGWYGENEQPAFYANQSYFRP